MRRFAAEARATVERAGAEARREGSRAIEAEHLLLALSAARDTSASRVLKSAGLDHEAIRDALDGAFRTSLRAAGVELVDRGPVTGRVVGVGHLRMGQSAKLVLQRALVVAAKRGDRQLRTSHLLVGLLRAEYGTVPRALAHAEIDRQDLMSSAEKALAG